MSQSSPHSLEQLAKSALETLHRQWSGIPGTIFLLDCSQGDGAGANAFCAISQALEINGAYPGELPFACIPADSFERGYPVLLDKSNIQSYKGSGNFGAAPPAPILARMVRRHPLAHSLGIRGLALITDQACDFSGLEFPALAIAAANMRSFLNALAEERALALQTSPALGDRAMPKHRI